MIEVGQKVRFIPCCFKLSAQPTAEEIREKTVTGVVVYINERHNFFCTEHSAGEHKLWEAHKFSDIGEAVKICGK